VSKTFPPAFKRNEKIGDWQISQASAIYDIDREKILAMGREIRSNLQSPFSKD
jgi:hypothetical protein